VQCTYDNTSDEVKTQGQSAEHNEMCMMTATYYPADADDRDPCVGLEGYGVGKATCTDTMGCVQKCPPEGAPRFSRENGGLEVGACWQQCFVQSCPNSGPPALSLVSCIGSKCAAECAGGGAACTQCATAKCGPQVQGCYGLACADLAP
jgi:hypothetical protein